MPIRVGGVEKGLLWTDGRIIDQNIDRAKSIMSDFDQVIK